MDSRDAVGLGPAACAQCVARVGQGSFRVRQARGVGSPSVPRCACRESAPAEDTDSLRLRDIRFRPRPRAFPLCSCAFLA